MKSLPRIKLKEIFLSWKKLFIKEFGMIDVIL